MSASAKSFTALVLACLLCLTVVSVADTDLLSFTFYVAGDSGVKDAGGCCDNSCDCCSQDEEGRCPAKNDDCGCISNSGFAFVKAEASALLPASIDILTAQAFDKPEQLYTSSIYHPPKHSC